MCISPAVFIFIHISYNIQLQHRARVLVVYDRTARRGDSDAHSRTSLLLNVNTEGAFMQFLFPPCTYLKRPHELALVRRATLSSQSAILDATPNSRRKPAAEEKQRCVADRGRDRRGAEAISGKQLGHGATLLQQGIERGRNVHADGEREQREQREQPQSHRCC